MWKKWRGVNELLQYTVEEIPDGHIAKCTINHILKQFVMGAHICSTSYIRRDNTKPEPFVLNEHSWNYEAKPEITQLANTLSHNTLLKILDNVF